MGKLQTFNAGRRTVSFGGIVAKTLGLALVILAVGLVGVAIQIWLASAADASRLQSFVVAVLLPTFQAIGTLVVAAGFFKGVLTALDNRSKTDNKEPINFFKW